MPAVGQADRQALRHETLKIIEQTHRHSGRMTGRQ